MDRKQYTSEKKLADRGWRGMRHLLDREMPVEPRRRIGWWVWALALLAPLAFVGGWAYHLSGEPAPRPRPQPAPAATPAHPTVPVAFVPAATPSADPSGNPGRTATHAGNVVTKKDGPGTNLPSKRQALTDASLAGASAQPKNTVSETPPPSSVPGESALRANGVSETNAALAPPATPTTDPQNTALTPAAGDASVQTTPAANPENPSPTNAVTSTENHSSALPVAAWPALASLAVRPAPLSMHATLPEAEPVAAFIRKNPSGKKWQFGAGVGALATGSLAYTGLTAGLAVDWQPLRRWSLRSGLSYQYLSYPVEETNILTLTADSYTKSTGYDLSGSGVFTTPSTQLVYVPVSTAHRLEIPVLVGWQPFRGFRLLAGVSAGKILQAEAGNRSVSNNIVYLIMPGQVQQNLNQNVSGQVSSWDARWSAGISYRPMRHLEIGVSYQRSFAQRRQPEYFSASSAAAQNQDPLIIEDIIHEQTSVSRARVVRNELFSLTGMWFF